jgi:hypothetical protein
MSLDLPFIEREINGTNYRATTLSLEHWADLTESLADLLGDPMASVLRGDMTTRASLMRSDIEFLIAGLISKVTKKKILEITSHMGRGLKQSDSLLTSKQQLQWWPSHMRDLAPVVALFLEAQYADFFEGLGDSLPQASQEESDPVKKESD